MQKIILAFLVLLLTGAVAVSSSTAGEIDVLLEKLVDKGVLSPMDASIIKDETAQQVAAEVSSGKSYAVPDWVQKMRIKGDLRLRYQKEKQSQADTEYEHRGRFRLRVGVEADVVDQVTVGFGLASGDTSDPKSTNQTFNSGFSSKNIWIDYAYAQWQVNQRLAVVGGKFTRKKWLWEPTDMLWDGDINPEGASFLFEDELAMVGDLNYWVSGGIWVINEIQPADKSNPFLKYVQGGLKYKKGLMDSTFALTFYDPQAIHKTAVPDSEGSNTTVGGFVQSTYRSISLASEIGFNEIFGGLPFSIDERIALIGEYIQNLDDNNRITGQTTGHAFGVKIGNKKVSDLQTWQLKYTKVKLGQDAWIDAYPDSDRGFGGETGIEGHEVAFEHALKKNVSLGLDYYKTWRINNPTNKEHLVQADILFKF